MPMQMPITTRVTIMPMLPATFCADMAMLPYSIIKLLEMADEMLDSTVLKQIGMPSRMISSPIFFFSVKSLGAIE